MKAWPSALSEEQQSRQIRTVLDELSWKLDIIKRLSCDASADASDDTEFAALQKVYYDIS